MRALMGKERKNNVKGPLIKNAVPILSFFEIGLQFSTSDLCISISLWPPRNNTLILTKFIMSTIEIIGTNKMVDTILLESVQPKYINNFTYIESSCIQ